jgi:hypothetical protein
MCTGYVGWRFRIMLGMRAVLFIVLFTHARISLETKHAPTFSSAAFYAFYSLSRIKFPVFFAFMYQVRRPMAPDRQFYFSAHMNAHSGRSDVDNHSHTRHLTIRTSHTHSSRPARMLYHAHGRTPSFQIEVPILSDGCFLSFKWMFLSFQINAHFLFKGKANGGELDTQPAFPSGISYSHMCREGGSFSPNMFGEHHFLVCRVFRVQVLIQ